jgi:tol-pal system protein YbgF
VRAVRALVVVAGALGASACFASRNDVLRLQAEVAAARIEALRADTARAAQLNGLAATLRRLDDSVSAVSTRASRFQGDAREQLRSIREQLIQVQELTGQSQRRLQDLRASLEASGAQAPPPAAPAPAGGTATPAASGPAGAGTGGGAGPSGSAPGGSSAGSADGAAPRPTAAPGPNELYRLATDQHRRGSYASARTGFQELLRRYPTADVAPDAQYFLAEAYAGERNAAGADSAYAAVVTRYPQSSRAPTALYKRARARLSAGRREDARALFEEVVRRYPRSDEAALAREALRGG